MSAVLGLVGLPNSGKTTLFNSLTGANQKVANFPGITVEKKKGQLSYKDHKWTLVDLPGLYTLDATSLDEKVSRDYIFEKVENKAQLFILVLDATNLKRSLYLALQLKEIGKKFVVALNMADLARKRGLKIDIDKLETALGAKVVQTCGSLSEGKESLLEKITDVLINEKNEVFSYPKDYQVKIKSTDYVKEKINQVEKITKEVTLEKISADNFTEKLDRFLLHPFFGPVAMFAIFLGMFEVLFSGADPFIGYIEIFFEWLGSLVASYVPEGLLQSLLIDGVIAGVGAFVVFLPHICLMFFMILFLEDFGYLGRVAFLLDYLMRKAGLPGKAVVPMLSSHACAIPGIMSARIIDDSKQRMLTMMIAPLMSCSARLPVYTLLIAAIIPQEKILGGFLSLGALVMFGLYMAGIASGVLIAFIGKKTTLRSAPSHLMMELPSYRIPSLKSIIYGTLLKAKSFITKAGTVILMLSVLIWGLVTFPKAPDNADMPAINYSAAAMIGKTFEPLFSPLGFDWKMTTALIPSFGAREVMVSAMGTVLAVQEDESNEDKYTTSLKDLLTKEYSLATLLSLLVWFIFSPQCIATFGVLYREAQSYKEPLIFGAYTLAMAYFFAFITYRLTLLFTS